MKHAATWYLPGCVNTTPYGVMVWHGSENSCFLPGYFRGSSVCFSAHWSGSEHGYVGRLRTSSPLHWRYLQPFMLGAMANPWTCPLLPENTNHRRVRISALQQKSTQEKPHCNNVNVLKSLLGGDNAYLMVTTICIYINWNECFSHNCSLSWRNMKGKKKSFLMYKCAERQAKSCCKK